MKFLTQNTGTAPLWVTALVVAVSTVIVFAIMSYAQDMMSKSAE